MAFLEEFNSCFGKGEWQIRLVYPKGLVVSGYKKILELSDTKIVLGLPQKKRLHLNGFNFIILTLAESEVFLQGTLSSLEIDNGNL